MSVKYISYIFEQERGTKGNDRLVLLALADSADDNGGSFSGVPGIAKKINCTPRRTQQILRKLEAAHKIIIQEGKGIKTRHGWTNRYTLVAPGINCTSYLNLCAKIGFKPVEFEALKIDKRGKTSPKVAHVKGVKDSSPLKDSSPQGVKMFSPQGVKDSSPKPSGEPSGEPEEHHPSSESIETKTDDELRETVFIELSKALKVSVATTKGFEKVQPLSDQWIKAGHDVTLLKVCVALHNERFAWKAVKGEKIAPPTFDQLLGYAMECTAEQGHDAAPGYDPACEHGCNKGYIDVFEGADVTRAKCSCRIQLEAKEKVQ